MRINNNLMAMNAHRQLAANSASTSKAMEKLSSGLRINRAGDDAAGLAISEKMRAQIRGLNQASRNAQDAVSLVQTAEGALSETQSILQRMRELAVQAANGTNEDTDREEIQKEINQLTSEINRIGNTTEFNKQVLLKGDIAITGDGKAVKAGSTTLGAGITAVNVDQRAGANTGVYDLAVTSNTVAKIEQNIQSNITDASVTAGDNVNLGGGAYKIAITAENTKQLDGAATDASSILNTASGNTSITLESNSSLNNVNHTLSVTKAQTASAVGSGLAITAGQLDSIDSGTYTIETERVFNNAAADITSAGTILSSGAVSNFKIAADATAAQVAAINGNAAGFDITTAIANTANNGEVSVKFSDEAGNSVTILTSALGNGAQKVKLGAIEFEVNVDEIISGVTGIGGGAPVNAGGAAHNATIKIANNAIHDKVTVSDGVHEVSDSVVSQIGGNMTFDLDSDGTDDFFLTSTSADFVQGNTLNVTVQSQYTIGLKETASGTQIGTNTVVTELQLAGNPNALTNLSFGGSGVLIDLSASALTSKAAGATYNVTFDVETAAGYTAELQKADGSAVDGAKYSLNASAAAGTTIDLGRDVKLTYDGADLATGAVYFGVNANVTEYTFKLTSDGGGTVYDTKTAQAGDTVEFSNGISLTTDAASLANSSNTTFEVENDKIDNSLYMQIGANQGQSFGIDISDMRSKALGISGNASGAIADGVGKDAAGARFATTENVTNGTNSTSIEYSLDVTDHTKASASIEVIEQAIERVSAERSKLGAFQNRLDHTTNNLDTSAENLQASESRIRDVDMAKEMMDYTKNNILSQAAQAMLAQANQAPQGVLQLLR